MDKPIEDLQAEFVNLLRKQVEALELEAYVGLSDAERCECSKRQQRILDLYARVSQSSDHAA
jgi:hypothetical protein